MSDASEEQSTVDEATVADERTERALQVQPEPSRAVVVAEPVREEVIVVNREEHSPWGELLKFLLLVGIFVVTVFAIAALRPLIFDQIVPAVLGWETRPVVDAPDSPGMDQADPQATAPAGAGGRPEETEDGEDGTTEATATITATVESPTPQVITYTVQSGDVLTHIARDFGVTLEALIEANDITNPDRIQPGTVLVIPPKEEE